MTTELFNHREEVARFAKVVKRNGKRVHAIDVNRWGLNEPFSDPENTTMYRNTLDQLATDTFVSEEDQY